MWRLAERGDATKAVAPLRKYLQEFKRDPGGWYYLGLALTRTGDLPGAQEAFKKALKLDSQSYLARIALARTYRRADDRLMAEKEGRRILGKAANSADSHYVFGVLELLSYDPLRALEEADASIEANSDFAQAHLLRSQAILLAAAGESWKPEVLTTQRQRMMDAAQSLSRYFALSSGESSNHFLLDQLQSIRFYAENSGLQVPSESYSQEGRTKARLLSKPEPQYTATARSAGIIGTVVLRAVFTAEGKIEHVLVLQSLPFGLSEKSIEAAKQIKFVPATKNGRSISMDMQLEYNFNLY